MNKMKFNYAFLLIFLLPLVSSAQDGLTLMKQMFEKNKDH